MGTNTATRDWFFGCRLIFHEGDDWPTCFDQAPRPIVLVKSAMCEQCEELDKKISHYRKLASSLSDEPTLLGIKKLIEKAEARKRALHPDQPAD